MEENIIGIAPLKIPSAMAEEGSRALPEGAASPAVPLVDNVDSSEHDVQFAITVSEVKDFDEVIRADLARIVQRENGNAKEKPTDIITTEIILDEEIVSPTVNSKQTDDKSENLAAELGFDAQTKLKQPRNKCIMCLKGKLGDLIRVSELDAYVDIIALLKQQCSVVISGDSWMCMTCSELLKTAYESIVSVKHLCQAAVKRHRKLEGDKKVYIQNSFAETLQRNLMKMFKSGRLCNTSLYSSDLLSEQKIHSATLAVSTSSFDDALEECKGIVLEGISKEGLEALVNYLYTGEFVLNKQMAKELLPHCQEWKLYWASSVCSEVLKSTPEVRKSPTKRVRRKPATKKNLKKKTKEKSGDEAQDDSVEVKREPGGEEANDESIEDNGSLGEEDDSVSVDTPAKRKSSEPNKKRVKRVKAEYDDDGNKIRPIAKCAHCGKEFSRVGSMREHIMRVHDKCRPFVCEHCGHSTTTRKDLQMHVRIKHADKIDQEEKTKFACSTCGLTRGSLTQLKLHMARKHSEERNCICEHCGMGFKTASNLREHSRYMHDPNMQMECTHDGCDRTFRGKFRLQEHMRRCHFMGDKRHKCQLCGYASHYSSSLRTHYSGKHNMKMSYLAPEWQAPHLKRQMFNKEREDLGEEAAPYVLEQIAKTSTDSGEPQTPYFPDVESGNMAERDIKPNIAKVDAAMNILKPDVLSSVVQDPEVNRILFGTPQTVVAGQDNVDQLAIWDGQYMQQITANSVNSGQLYAQPAGMQAAAEPQIEHLVCSDKREHDAAVALITVGKQEDPSTVSQALEGQTYQLHVENHGQDLYIVMPKDWKPDQTQ